MVSGALLAHEATHTLQYAAAGFFPFLAAYVVAYARGLWRARAWDAPARMAAYRAIPAEQEAETAERAWRQLPLAERESRPPPALPLRPRERRR